MFGLSKNKVTKTDIESIPVDAKLFLIAINEVINAKTFYVCDVKKAIETFNLTITDRNLYKKIGLLHCVEYKNMEPDVYQFLIESIKTLVKTAKPTYTHHKHIFTFNDFIPGS